jgi:hypothetical protein
VVFYAQNGKAEWVVERTSDGEEMARGSLEAMIGLIEGEHPQFLNARRAHEAEDIMRWRPKIFEMDWKYPLSECGRPR